MDNAENQIDEFILAVLRDPERREVLMEHLTQLGFHADAPAATREETQE